MMFLPNPYIILGAIVAAVGMYFYGHHNGWAERDAEMQIAIAKKNDEARQIEQKLTEQVNANAGKLQEATNAITQKQSALDRAIRAGRVRLPTSGCVSTPESPAAPAGNRDEAPSDADRQVLELIAQLIAEGDRNTAQLNACIDAYNAARQTLSGTPGP